MIRGWLTLQFLKIAVVGGAVLALLAIGAAMYLFTDFGSVR